MAKVNGKQKGNGFERDIANTFSSHFQNITLKESAFRRNPDSGSFFGGQNQARTDTHDTDYAVYGDLICPRDFKFCVECKFYKDPPTVKSIINESVSQWDEWIGQVEQDAKNSCKHPLLIVKYNRTGVMCFIKEDDCDKEVLEYIMSNDLYAISYKGYVCVELNRLLQVPTKHFFI